MKKQINIIKRDGSVEPLEISKIQKYTKLATEGLKNVNQSELEVDAQIQFKNKMSSEEIQQTLIKTAVDKIDIDRPNWTFVAARLFLYDLYHKVSGFDGYRKFTEYLKVAEDEGKFIRGLKEQFNIERLEEAIQPERDFKSQKYTYKGEPKQQFTYLGIKTLYDRYLLKDKSGYPIELPQEMFMGISMFLAQRENDLHSITDKKEKLRIAEIENKEEQEKEIKTYWAIKFYDMLSEFEVMMATPTLSNARTPRHQMSSCYVTSVPDSIEGIFDAYKEYALLSKYGGGIGSDWSNIRAMGSSIDKTKGASGGPIPFLKITNDIALAVDQLGTRKGAIAVYMEPWHLDIEDFLDLKKNSGEERRRAHDIFPALWINDLFMKRIEANDYWTLFDPSETPELTSLYGEEFEKKYEEYEQNPAIRKSRIKAKELWKVVLRSYFETGTPFLCFKDNANRRNPNDHEGIIRSSNLCTEIFQNTEPNKYKVKIELEEGQILYFDEDDAIINDAGILKPAKKISSIDRIFNKQVFMASKTAVEGETAVCNLASVNLSRINSEADINRVVPIAIRALDNVIDLNFYPVRKAKITNLRSRAIGLGVMGEAQMLAEAHIHWGTEDHLKKIDEVMEMVSYNAISASSDLAIHRSFYSGFKGSKWEKGIFPYDTANEEAKSLVNRELKMDWRSLKEKVKLQGMRNGYLMAVAPTSSISILVGTTQAIEAVYKRKWTEENLSGNIPIVVPNLDPDTYQYYTTAYDLDQKLLVKAAAIRQKWIDQGQSLNIFINSENPGGKLLHDIYSLAWKLGLKSTYYLRSKSPEISKQTEEGATNKSNKDDDDVIDRSMECFGCQ